MRELQTSGEVIDALGGTAGLAAALGRRMTVVSNWRTAGSFPANTYLILTEMLARLDLTAPSHLWKMVSDGGRLPRASGQQEAMRA